MQSFALAVAKLCVGGCKALRWHMQCFASGMGKTGTEIVSHILDKSKGRKDSPYVALQSPLNFYGVQFDIPKMQLFLIYSDYLLA